MHTTRCVYSVDLLFDNSPCNMKVRLQQLPSNHHVSILTDRILSRTFCHDMTKISNLGSSSKASFLASIPSFHSRRWYEDRMTDNRNNKTIQFLSVRTFILSDLSNFVFNPETFITQLHRSTSLNGTKLNARFQTHFSCYCLFVRVELLEAHLIFSSGVSKAQIVLSITIVVFRNGAIASFFMFSHSLNYH